MCILYKQPFGAPSTGFGAPFGGASPGSQQQGTGNPPFAATGVCIIYHKIYMQIVFMYL